MSQAISPSANQRYGLARVCRVWDIARSSVYATRKTMRSIGTAAPRSRRGPRGAATDADLVMAIEKILAESPWIGEGYRKVWARLRRASIRTSPRRVLRLMREHALQVPVKLGPVRGPQHHDGSIISEWPDTLWGTDATSTLTQEGNATIFFVIDHCTAECLGIHAARYGSRFEAIRALRQAVRGTLGSIDASIAEPHGLRLRHDHGSQFISHSYQAELRFLAIESSPAFVRQPEGNGCAERFVRTLKEQLLWLMTFTTVAELNAALEVFRRRYNDTWIIQRHGYVSPSEQRRRLVAAA